MSTPASGRNAALGPAQLTRLLGEWEGAGPAYAALADRIRVLVVDGRIPSRTWLPSERALADALGKSRTTVIAAYARLRDEGCLHSVRGAGSYVSLSRRADDGAHHGTTPTILDLSKAAPPMWPGLPALFAEAAERLATIDLGVGYDLVGQEPLRRQIAERYEARGLPTRPSQILVTLGGQHAIYLAARTLAARGDRAMVETPSYPHAYEALRLAGARLDGFGTVPVTVDGWDMDRLERVLTGIRPALAYVIPDHHNPTGASMTLAERTALVRTAERVGTVLLVDETTADLDIDAGTSPVPVAALAREAGSVVTIGSLGKTVWGGLRLGWIRADERVIDRLVTARAASDMGTPGFDQLVGMLALGRMDEIITHRRTMLARSRDLAIATLAEQVPEWQVPHPTGGMSLWVGLGSPSSSALILAARARGLVITAGPRFGIDGAFERHLRVPFTGATEELEPALRILVDAWRSLPGGVVPQAEPVLEHVV